MDLEVSCPWGHGSRAWVQGGSGGLRMGSGRGHLSSMQDEGWGGGCKAERDNFGVLVAFFEACTHGSLSEAQNLEGQF